MAARLPFAARRYRKKNVAYWSGRKKIAPSKKSLALLRENQLAAKKKLYANGGRERMQAYRRSLRVSGGAAGSGTGDTGGTGIEAGGGVGGDTDSGAGSGAGGGVGKTRAVRAVYKMARAKRTRAGQPAKEAGSNSLGYWLRQNDIRDSTESQEL
jgi:hypothetical protein